MSLYLQNQPPGWTQPRIAELTKLWADGLSASQIAECMGDDLTRNAVIGKARRLGLPGRPNGQHSGGRPRTGKPRVDVPLRRVRAKDSSGKALPFVSQIAVGIDPPSAEFNCDIVGLNEATSCRFPIGDPKTADFRYCGVAKKYRNYCAYHAAMSYQNLSPAKVRETVAA